ncbi:MAG: MFS transporter [Betaproteobacteria bacterium]|jgi:PPP family 3-phenylpropionic acid transporter
MGVPAVPLATFYFFYFAFLGAFAPFWPLYLKSAGMGAAQIGTLLALVPVTRMAGPALWGWLADHRGRRTPVVRLTSVATVVAFTGFFAGSAYAWLFAVMLVMNIFWCGSLPLVEATTMAHLGDRVAGYGRIRAWGSVGFVAVVVGAGSLLDLAGVRSLPWLILGLLALHAASAFAVPEAPRHAHHDDARGVWEILRRREVLALFAGCFLMSVAHGPYHTFYSIWLVEHGYSKTGVGMLWALGVICEIIVFFLWTRLTARFEPRTLLLIAYGTACLRFLAVGWAPGSAVVIVLAQTAHAATFGLFHGAAVALTHRFFRGRHQSKGQALYSGVGFGAGGAAGGLASGFVWDHAGGPWTFTGGAVAGLMACLVTWRWLRADGEPGMARVGESRGRGTPAG